MFESRTDLIDALTNPMKVASLALTEIEERLNGTKVIADPNSPFCHLLEFGSSISSAAINGVHEYITALYPSRAVSVEDLYHHMSDYDYLHMYSTPSSTTIRLTLPKKYLADNALPVGGEGYETYLNGEYVDNTTDYKKLTIPKDTVFMIGKYPFGIYYPIDILIHKITGTFSVVYDTHYSNPLQVLSKNVIEKYDATFRGLEYIIVDIPIYQFAKSVVEDSLISTTGFAKKYVYNNDFYAIRIFNYSDGNYTELAQTQSYMVYDAQTPTAMVNIYPDEHKFSVIIPQIYFDQGQMGSKLYMEVYTTLGEMDINTTNIDMDSIRINYGTKTKDSTQYSSLFASLPFDNILQFKDSKITGGTSMIDITTLRNKIISDTLYDKVPITEADLSDRLAEYGFTIKKYLDNVTNRIYYAYHTICDSDGSIIPSATMTMKFSYKYSHNSADNSEYRSSFIEHTTNNITVLPTTIYEYTESTNSVIPITNTAYASLATMDKEDLIEYFNNGKYYKSPYHMRICLESSRPFAEYFDLMTPTVETLIFEAENYNTSAKMIVFDTSVTHLDEGVGGYKVYLSVYKSDDIAVLSRDELGVFHSDLDQQNILLVVLVKTDDGRWIQSACTYEGTNSTKTRDIYSFTIQTKYDLGTDGYISVDNFSYNGEISTNYIALESRFHIIFMTRRAVFAPGNPSNNVIDGITEDINKVFVGIARQFMDIKLGSSLSDVLHTNMEVSADTAVYEKYETSVASTYEGIQYLSDTAGYRTVHYTIDEDDYVVIDKDGDNRYAIKFYYDVDEETFKYTRTLITVDDDDIETGLIQVHKAGEIKQDITCLQLVIAHNDLNDTKEVVATAKQWLAMYETYKTAAETLQTEIATLNTEITNLTNENITKRNIIEVNEYGENSEQYITLMNQINTNLTKIATDQTKIAADQTKYNTYMSKYDTFAQDHYYFEQEVEDGCLGFYSHYKVKEAYKDDDITIYQHIKGEVKLDDTGTAKLESDREKIYYIDTMLIDSKIFVSEKQIDLDFQSNIYTYLNKYFEQIRDVQAEMLEQTALYFRCIKSSGSATFNMGNGITTNQSVEMTFNIACYVPSYVKNDTSIQDEIAEKMCKIIEATLSSSSKISMLDIFNDIKNQMSDYIEYFTLLGINDDVTNQTFEIVDEGAQASIDRKLVLTDDNIIALKKQVNIEFIALDDNTSEVISTEV